MALSAQGGAATAAIAVTPSDSTVITITGASGNNLTPYGLWVGGAGNVSVTMQNGANAQFQGVAAGTLLPIRYTKVLAATTATLLVALF